MKILINYADKQYEPARKWNTLTGRYIARFDKVYKKQETACGFGNLIL